MNGFCFFHRLFNLVPNRTNVVKTRDSWITRREISMSTNANYTCLLSIHTCYVNMIQKNVFATNVGITLKFDCIITNRGSSYVAVSNTTNFHATVCVRAILLVNNHRILDFIKYNIFVCNVPRISRSSLINHKMLDFVYIISIRLST